MENETAQARALRLLEEIYELTKDKGQPVHSIKLAATIGSSEAEALAGWRHLKHLDLINTHNLSSHTGPASVNAHGIALFENARKHPDQPPPGFGVFTYNTIHIQHMHGGGIQQAGAHATQHQTIYNSQDFDELRNAIEILSQRIDELNLDAATKKNALAQVDTIKAQLSADEPSSNIIREAGKSLRNITEGAIGGLIATGVTEHWPLVLGVLTGMFG